MTAFITFRLEYFIPLLKTSNESRIFSGFIIKFGFFISLIATFLIYLLSLFEFQNFKIDFYYYFAPLTAFSISFALVLQHEAQRNECFKISAYSEVASKFSYIIFGILGSFLSSSIGLILTTFFGAIGKTLFLLKYLKRIKYKSSGIEVALKFKNVALGMIFANTLLTFTALILFFFIEKFYGMNYLGQFSLVISTVFLPSGLIGSAVGAVFYQRGAVLVNEVKIDDLKILWKDNLVKLISLSFPIYFIIFIFGDVLYAFVFGEKWSKAGEISEVLAVAAFFSFISGPLDRIGILLNVRYYLFFIHTVRFLLTISGIYFCFKYEINEYYFLWIYVFFLCLIYTLDIIFGRYFIFLKGKYECKVF